MNDNFKNQLAAFAADIREICHASGHDGCVNCPLRFNGGKDGCAASSISESNYNFDQSIAAVEAYRKHKKPCAEVIDRALDVYTLEVEVERDRSACSNRSVDRCAEHLKQGVWQYYCSNDATVRVLSAKRFVLESHREEE